MIDLRICVGNNGDTLRKIAKQLQVEVDELLFQNPLIETPDQHVSGLHIKLPSADSSSGIPLCPLVQTSDLKQWIPLTPLQQMAETEYDVLIVGSGAGGGAVLWRLAEQLGDNGAKIGLVEAGDLFLPTHAYNVPTLNTNQSYQLAHNISDPIGKDMPEFPGAVNKIVFGGGTLFWGTVCPRMTASEIRKWPLSLQEMDFYYNAAESIMNVNRDFSKGSSITEVLLGRLYRNGFTEAAARPMAVDLSQTNHGYVHSNVFFSSNIFFAYALNRRPVDLTVKTRVVKVLTDNGKAVGVEVVSPDNKTHLLKAKKVVLSAGVLQTPRIILNSGIKGRAIGHYLTNHSAVLAYGALKRGEFPEVLGTLNILVPESDDKPFQVEIGRNDGFNVYKYEAEPVLKELKIYYFALGKTESLYENHLTLDPSRKDEYGLPRIQVHYSWSEQDNQIIRQMKVGVSRVASAVNAPLVSPDGDFPAICQYQQGQEFHTSSTCRIGYDPTTAAANPYGEIFGVSGLYVADNSMLPSMSAANPTLSTVALAIRTADHIAQQFRN